MQLNLNMYVSLCKLEGTFAEVVFKDIHKLAGLGSTLCLITSNIESFTDYTHKVNF